MDAGGIAVDPISGLWTSEKGDAATFTVVLQTQPAADVTIALVSSDTTEGTVAPASLVFTATDWNTPQTATVSGVDDSLADGDQPYQAVLGPAVSADPEYQGVDPADVAMVNFDRMALDVDGDGQAAGWTDGLLMVRYLFEFRGTSLVRGVIASGATRQDSQSVTAYLDGLKTTVLDVDGNGEVEGLTDGMLLLRHLFGFTGTSLTRGVLGPGALRQTPDAVSRFLQAHVPSSGSGVSVEATDVAYRLTQGGSLSVPAAQGVLVDDTGPAGAALEAVLASRPAHGSLSLLADGSFRYTPEQFFFGIDRFTYQARAGQSTSGAAAVTLTVDAPAGSLVIADDFEDGIGPEWDSVLGEGVVQGVSHGDGSQAFKIRYEHTEDHGPNAAGYLGRGNLTFHSIYLSYWQMYPQGCVGRCLKQARLGQNDGGEEGYVTQALFYTAGYWNMESVLYQQPGWSAESAYPIAAGQWSKFAFYVKYNDPGQSNGIYRLYQDDRLVCSVEDFVYTQSGEVADLFWIGGNYSGAGVDPVPFDRYIDDALIVLDPTGDPSDRPLGEGDGYTAYEGNTLSVVAAKGVLTNDHSPASRTLTSLLIDPPAHGTVTLDPEGSFQYTPAQGFLGLDYFSYRANDGQQDSGRTVVEIRVEPQRSVLIADDFESGRRSADWSETTDGGQVVAGMSHDDGQNSYCIHHDPDTSDALGRFHLALDSIYVSYWQRVSATIDNGSLSGAKLYRSNAGATPGGATFNLSFNPAQGNLLSLVLLPGTPSEWASWNDYALPANQWVHTSVYLKYNTPGQANGVYRLWRNDQLVCEATNLVCVTPDSELAGRADSLSLESGYYGDGPAFDHYFDDVLAVITPADQHPLPAQSLGPVDIRTLTGLDPSVRDLWYSFDTTEDGSLMLQASSAQTAVMLYNAQHDLCGVSTRVGTTQRIDRQVTAGETYYVRLVGGQPQVDLQISNTPLPAASMIAQPSGKSIPNKSPCSRAADAAFALHQDGWLPSDGGPDLVDAAASALRRRPRLLVR